MCVFVILREHYCNNEVATALANAQLQQKHNGKVGVRARPCTQVRILPFQAPIAGSVTRYRF